MTEKSENVRQWPLIRISPEHRQWLTQRAQRQDKSMTLLLDEILTATRALSDSDNWKEA